MWKLEIIELAKVYLGLGTNLGDKEQNLRDAVQKIEEQVGKIVSLSAFYITAPWGFSSDNSFLNAAVCVDTELATVNSYGGKINLLVHPSRSEEHTSELQSPR